MLSKNDNNSILSLFLLALCFFAFGSAQYHNFNEVRSSSLIWCTVNLEEQYKCQNFTAALERDRALFEDNFYNITCYQAFNSEECIQMINTEGANIMTLEAGEVFLSGRYYSLIPLMQETYEGGFNYYYAVAVVKTGTMPEVTHIRGLRGKKACFAGVGTYAGWTIPIHTLQNEGSMEILDCNNHIKNAIGFFGESCAVNSLLNKNNPIGDNSDKLCAICTGKVPIGKCTSADPYAGYEGAFRCLLEAGDIAFLKHTTVNEMILSKQFKSVTSDRFELLCTNGQRKPLSEYRECNWGAVPSNALVVSSARTKDERKHIQNFFTKALRYYTDKTKSSLNTTSSTSSFSDPLDRNKNNVNRYNIGNDPNTNTNYNPSNNRYNNDPYNANTNNYDRGSNNRGRADNNPFDVTTDKNLYDNETQFYEKFRLFESERYGRLNLMFEDTTHSLIPIRYEDQSFGRYLKESLDVILGIRQCPVGKMTLCVTSDPEMEKCVKMRTALKAQLIKPEMICYKAHSHINCMQAIQSGVADITVFDASDVYTAGLRHNLIPIISEVYNLGQPEYYVVAVAKEEDPDTEITYLKGKNTCHTGINTAAGWVYPMAYLISNGWIRPYGCDSVRAAAEYFSKSCIPGALSTEYNTGVPYDNMCDLCHGASYRYCRRDASEDYYGHTGALKCLVEGGGNVAFVKHTTVQENTGGKRNDFWARNTLNFDFELLCPDGTRAYLNEYARCNLGKVKANAIVTRGGSDYNDTEIKAYTNLFVYAQQYYGRKDADDFSFSMFYSLPPYHDLIFQDATRQLRVIEPEKRHYDVYLGKDFMRARRITDCNAGASQIQLSIITTFCTILIRLFF